MAGAEPRDFYLFMWMVGMRLRAEIVVMFKKGGRPQCSNTQLEIEKFHLMLLTK